MSINLNPVPFNEIGKAFRGTMKTKIDNKTAITIMVVAVAVVGGLIIYDHIKKKKDENKQ